MLEGYINAVRDKLNLIKTEGQQIAESHRKISDALAGIDNSKNTIFGATVENTIDLISEYELRGGNLPMSSESIRKAFRPDKVSFSDSYIGSYSRWAAQKGLNDFYRRKVDSIQNKKVDSEYFAAKVQDKLYEILPLEGVLTDYRGAILRQGDVVWLEFKPALVVDNRIAIAINQINQGLAAEEIASKIALEIMRTHLYTWKAFAARVFQCSEDHLDVIYGVLEDKA